MRLHLVALDTGVLGLVTHPKPSPEAAACSAWVATLTRNGVRVVVPAIADYELRREYELRNAFKAISELNTAKSLFGWLSITDETLQRAAQLWAQSRRMGQPTSDAKALDGDCILVAQTQLEAERLNLQPNQWIIATTDVGDLPRLAPAQRWSDITSSTR